MKKSVLFIITALSSFLIQAQDSRIQSIDSLVKTFGKHEIILLFSESKDTLGPAERRQVVVPRQRVAHRRRRDAVRRHLVRLQPDPHRERAGAEDVGALHAADGAQLRLHDARQVVGDLVRIEVGRREAEIDRRELVVGRLQLDDRRLRLGRQIVAHLRDLGLNLRQRGVGVVVELQVHGDRAERLRARRFHVVDAVGAGDDALERRRDEAAHEVRVRADVGGRDADDRDVAARILPDAQRADRLQPRDEDDQVDDDREDRPFDEEIGELHQLFSGFGVGLFARPHLVVDETAAPLRSLNTPEVTTSSPGLTPETTATWSPRAAPSLTNCWRTPR